MTKPLALLPLPSLKPSLLPWTARLGITEKLMALVAEAGFDGIEALYRNETHAQRLRELADANGLRIHFHQIWTLKGSPSHWHNHVLAGFGLVSNEGIPLCISPNARTYTRQEPFVAYGEIDTLEQCQFANIWVQTCPNHDSGLIMHDERFTSFCEHVRKRNHRVVFDTHHVLELMVGRMGIEYLSTNTETLLSMLIQAWDILGPYTTEIHLNDIDPRRGHTSGRSLLIGTGILPLRSFWDHVVRGKYMPQHIVPEVHPDITGGIRPSVESLRMVRDTVRRCTSF
jgi:Xylose isomerase-like TIM barrel